MLQRMWCDYNGEAVLDDKYVQLTHDVSFGRRNNTSHPLTLSKHGNTALRLLLKLLLISREIGVKIECLKKNCSQVFEFGLSSR